MPLAAAGVHVLKLDWWYITKGSQRASNPLWVLENARAAPPGRATLATVAA